MRFAYVATRIPHRQELAPGPVDTEWLQGQDVTVFVDNESAGSQALREAGITVHTSPKRPATMPDGTVLIADHVQAALLVAAHRESPFDFILYDSAQTTDFAWFEPDLRDLPRGVALGPGMVDGLRLVLDDASLFQHFGRALWSTTGFIASADFLVSDVYPDALGFAAPHLPPAFSLRSPAKGTAAAAPRMVVVAATATGVPGLADVVVRAAAAVGDDGSASFVVIHTELPLGPGTTRDVLLDGCPDELRRRVVIAPPGEDGVAAAFLAASDAVVAASPGDLAVPGVSATHLLSGAWTAPPPLTAAPPVPAQIRAILVPVTGATATADRLLAEMDADVAVLHAPGTAVTARRFLRMPRLDRIDLAITATPEPTLGAPIADLPIPDLLVAHRRTWPALRRRLATAGSLEELVVWCLGLSLAEHVRLGVFPSEHAEGKPLPVDDVPGLPPWTTSSGILPRPNLAAVGAGTETVSGPGMRDWVERSSWRERASLVLPWRWGLLERAMKDRW